MNEGENPEIIYDYLGRRMYTVVSEAGIDSDEISEKIDYSKQAMILNRRQKNLAKKAIIGQIEKPSCTETLTYEEHGAIFIFHDLAYAIRKDDHGPVQGQKYVQLHILNTDAKNTETNVCASVLINATTGCEEVYLESHGDNLKKGKRNIKIITKTENEIKLRDAAIFMMQGDPQEHRRSPKKKKATLLSTKIPPKYSFKRTR